MKFVATLRHDPEDCLARDENAVAAARLLDRVQFAEEDFGITVLGAYCAANEHTYYFVFDADSSEDVVEWLGPPFLQTHDAQVSPVYPVESLHRVELADSDAL